MAGRGAGCRGLRSCAKAVFAFVFLSIILIAPGGASDTTTYSYDALGRLTATTTSGTANGGLQTSTSFDPAGNRAAYAVSGATSSPNVVSLSISNASASEGGSLTFTITKLGTATAPVSVNFVTANGSAVAGSDYNAASGTLTFAPAETSKTITITTIDDNVNEPGESFSVTLSAATGGATINGAVGTGTINDNDPAPTFTIGNGGPVTEGGSLTFTVTKTGATSVSVDVYFSTADGSAVAGSDYNAASGGLTFAPSDVSKTITISTIDDGINEPTETFTVSLSATNGGAAISIGTGTINDNDAAPSFSISNASAVSEGAALSFTVIKSGATSQSYAVNFATANGSAVAGSDFNATSGTLLFAPGETSKSITVSTIDDGINEPTETFTMSLSAPSGGATIGTGTGTGTINDNDPPPSFSISNAGTITEGSVATFTVSKSGTTVQTYAVNFSTADGSAVAGDDYIAASGTLTFAPGDTSKTITVSTIDDAVNEPTETFSASLSAPTGGATIGTVTGSATINDNDTPPSFSIGNAVATEGGALVFTVTKSGATVQTYAVNFTTADGSAVAGGDYYATSGTLTFAPGDTSKTINVSTIDDAVNEPTETFSVSLSSPTGGATIGTVTGIGTINDNDVPPPAPVAQPDSISFNCSLTRTLNVVANDYDPNGYTPLSLVSATSSDPDQMWVNIVNSTTISMASSNAGTYYVNYVIRNTAGGTASSYVTVTIVGTSCQIGPPITLNKTMKRYL